MEILTDCRNVSRHHCNEIFILISKKVQLDQEDRFIFFSVKELILY